MLLQVVVSFLFGVALILCWGFEFSPVPEFMLNSTEQEIYLNVKKHDISGFKTLRGSIHL